METNTLDPVLVEVSDNSNSPLNFLDSLHISNDVKRRLSNYLKSLIPGSNAIHMTPICESHGPEQLLLEWDSIFNSKGKLINDTLRDLELLNKSKFGPRSIAKPWKTRKQALSEYFDDDRPYTFNFPPELSSTHKNLRPIDFRSAVSHLKNDTNSGLPYFIRKGSIKDKIKKMTLDEFLYKVGQAYPSILFTRTQEGDKTRDVWGYPIFLTIYEMMYYIPLLAYQRNLLWRSALKGPEFVDRSISELIFKCVNDSSKILVSIDFSSFDKTVLTGISNYAFDYIKSLFQSGCSYDIDNIKTYFQEGGLVTPDGIMYGKHGVPSGSTFTNEVDSIVQYIVAKSSNVTIDTSYQIQGDDGVYLINNGDYEKLISTFERAGLKVNTSKSYSSNDYCIYLQNLYHRDYIRSNGLVGGIYPTYRALCRILYQERFVNFLEDGIEGRDYYSIRTISILENCKYHPLFKEFVQFVLSKDKYLLAFSEGSVIKYDKIVNQGPGTGGFLNNQYGDVITGINSFETMRVIRELRDAR